MRIFYQGSITKSTAYSLQLEIFLKITRFRALFTSSCPWLFNIIVIFFISYNETPPSTKIVNLSEIKKHFAQKTFGTKTQKKVQK